MCFEFRSRQLASRASQQNSVQSSEYRTRGCLTIEWQKEELPYEGAMNSVLTQIDTRRGAIFASGYEYPGRYTRWDIGFVNPPVELVAQGRNFTFRALNERGVQLIFMFQDMLQEHQHLASLVCKSGELRGVVKEMSSFFFEEDRSKQPTVFSILRTIITCMHDDQCLDDVDQHLGFYGAFGYDLVFQFTPIVFKQVRTGSDLHLFLPDELYVVDHRLEKAYRMRYDFISYSFTTVGHKRAGSEFPVQYGSASAVICDHVEGEYPSKVQQIIDGAGKGDFFEVVLSQQFETGFTGTPGQLFERIRRCNPSPYEFLINLGSEQLVGASPEMFVRVEERQVETCPISGTIRRGRNALEDADQMLKLLNSAKDRSELDMCTDVDRNDKSRVCKPGTIQIIARRLIESYSKLFHTVDHVVGELMDDFDGIDALLAHMWAVTLTGAPKRAAMQMIEDLEKSARGWYGGCVGMLLFNGNVNTGITIRTVFLKDGCARIRVGSTLLYDSVPADEEQETRLKAEAFINAVLGDRAGEAAKPAVLPLVGKGKMVLFVNNQDSFVHTLASYVRQTGAEVKTIDAGLAMQVLQDMVPDLVFISPGPGWPQDFGVPELVLFCAKRKIPVFGVCLGLQGIVEAFGGKLGVLSIPVHGKASTIVCNQASIFIGFPKTFRAGRYHTLCAREVPGCFEVTARTEDGGIVMAIQHKELPIAAVQFHPESLLTLHDDIGLKLIYNMMSELVK